MSATSALAVAAGVIAGGAFFGGLSWTVGYFHKKSLLAVRAEVEGEVATATFELMVVGIRGEERYLLVGRPMQPENLKVSLVKESGDWKIAEVERAPSEE